MTFSTVYYVLVNETESLFHHFHPHTMYNWSAEIIKWRDTKHTEHYSFLKFSMDFVWFYAKSSASPSLSLIISTCFTLELLLNISYRQEAFRVFHKSINMSLDYPYWVQRLHHEIVSWHFRLGVHQSFRRVSRCRIIYFSRKSSKLVILLLKCSTI